MPARLQARDGFARQGIQDETTTSSTILPAVGSSDQQLNQAVFNGPNSPVSMASRSSSGSYAPSLDDFTLAGGPDTTTTTATTADNCDEEEDGEVGLAPATTATNAQTAAAAGGNGGGDDNQTETAGSVAKDFCHNNNISVHSFKAESAMSKRIAVLPAQRDPEPRDLSHKPNLQRRGNVESVLAQIAGQEAPKPCKSCRKGHGPWAECVVLEGSLCGSCANCWYNACGARCTFHENKSKPVDLAPIIVAPPSPAGPPTSTQEQQQPLPAANNPQQQQQQQSLPPISPALISPITPGVYTPYPTSAATTTTTTVAAMGTSTLQPAPAPTANPQIFPPITAAPPYLSLPQLLSSFSQWGLSGPTGHLVAQSAADSAVLSRRERSVARLQAAAEELGMMVAEFTENYGDHHLPGIIMPQSQQQQQQQQLQHPPAPGTAPNSSNNANISWDHHPQQQYHHHHQVHAQEAVMMSNERLAH